LKEVFFPNIRIPILYIFADSHPQAANVATRRAIDRASSHAGTPKGILESITIGDVNGIMEPHHTIALSGALNA
jgi:hypothetical protein